MTEDACSCYQVLIILVFIPFSFLGTYEHIDRLMDRLKKVEKGGFRPSAELLVGALAPRSIKRQPLAAAAARSARHMALALQRPAPASVATAAGAAAPSVRPAVRSAVLFPSASGTVCILALESVVATSWL